MEPSRRDLSNDMAEHKSILKNYQNAHLSIIFQDRPMLSHIDGKLSPRRDLLNDAAEHRSILKNNQNTHGPVLVSHPKQVWYSLKRLLCLTPAASVCPIKVEYNKQMRFGN